MPDQLPSPWKEFLTELDGMLKDRVDLHCVGGFIFVYFYGLPRTTGDIDYYTSVPHVNLTDMAGEGSELHKKHKVFLHEVRVTSMPEDYDQRLVEMLPGQFINLHLFVPDPYDAILSKLDRNSSKDRDDADYLFRALKLDSKTLKERYEKELRDFLIGPVERHDNSMKIWIEIFKTER